MTLQGCRTFQRMQLPPPSGWPTTLQTAATRLHGTASFLSRMKSQKFGSVKKNTSRNTRKGRDSSVGTTTHYVLDSLGIESRWELFRIRPYRPWGQPSLLYNGYRDFFGGKAAGTWLWPPTLSSAEVKERVELYLYSPSGHSWPVLGWPLPFIWYKTFSSGSLKVVHWKSQLLDFPWQWNRKESKGIP